MALSTKLQSPLTSKSSSVSALARPVRVAGRQRQVAANALATQIVISGATAASLALGRFVFLPFQRDNVARQGIGNNLFSREAGEFVAIASPCLTRSHRSTTYRTLAQLAGKTQEKGSATSAATPNALKDVSLAGKQNDETHPEAGDRFAQVESANLSRDIPCLLI